MRKERDDEGQACKELCVVVQADYSSSREAAGGKLVRISGQCELQWETVSKPNVPTQGV